MNGGFRHEQVVQERESCVGKECYGSQEQSVINLGTALGCFWGKIVMRREGVDTKYAR